MKKDLACHCGDSIFTLRLNALEEVGVITCSFGHHSFLLDSRDYWGDVIEDGKPRESQCKCKSKTYKVALSYTFRTDRPDVSQVDVIARCHNCGYERLAMTIEIDYGPTTRLMDHPLDPCDNPWLRTRKVKCSSLWEQKDLEDFICHVMDQNIKAYLVTSNSVHPSLDKAELLDLLRRTPSWDLYLFVDENNHPCEEVVAWKEKPVVHVWGPQIMVDKTGSSTNMYFIEYAEEVIRGAQVIRQPEKFLTFTKVMTNWLKETYTSERGKDSFDNSALYQKF
ncbi:hypothetical protein EG832_18655, partial [bacterium]|nr:hypothetical protein [bacterium]